MTGQSALSKLRWICKHHGTFYQKLWMANSEFDIRVYCAETPRSCIIQRLLNAGLSVEFPR